MPRHRKTLTVDEIMAMRPCEGWPRDRVAALFGVRKRLGLKHLESFSEEVVPLKDRVWLLLQMVSDEEKHLLACRFAERALRRERKVGRDPAPACWEAIRVKRLWARGKATDEELEAGYSAACSAGYSAAYSAGYSDAYSAACSDACSAAYSAERRWQYQLIMCVIRGELKL